MLNPRDQAILEQFSLRLRQRFPDARIYAYGSRVRGDHDDESDLDVCVVLDQLDINKRKAISGVAWEVGFENSLLIVTIAFSAEAFDRFPGVANPLVQAILEEGIAA